jgi:protein involved in polysaccharide export with SLBB domain
MKITFTNFALAVGFSVAFATLADVPAQTTPAGATTTTKTSVKRNSPFSPNPKKKTETALPPRQEAATAPNKFEAKEIKIQNGAVGGDKKNNSAEETQNADFESRSAANQTLEIARRNSSAGGGNSERNAAKKPTEIYRVGVGDVLDIRLLNSPTAKTESTLFTVLENGMIDYPLAGGEPMQAAGLTTDEIEDFLREKVKLYENPEIAVTVRDYASHTISVLGMVERPGQKALRREAIPLYAILAEAIPHSSANEVVILRGADKQTLTVGLDDSETLIYPNDIVRVVSGGGGSGGNKASKSQPRFYFIGGQINSVGQKDFHDGLTLTQAILASGGLKKSSARRVTVRRRDAEGKLVPTEYDLKLIKEGKIADPVLQAGDTVEIGN